MHLRRIVKKTIKLIVCSLAFFCALLVGSCWLVMELASPSHESDDILLQNFANNRAVFEEIVTKVQKDGDISKIGDNWYMLTDGVSRDDTPERIVQYRKLFKRISVGSGIQVTYPSKGNARVLFYSNCIGFLSPGSCKGYAYEPYPKDATILVDNIDDYKPKTTKSSFWWIYKAIKGENNWYLYYESNN